MRADYINENKLQQDHPCVIDIIRRDYLNPPASWEVPYILGSSTEPNGDPSPGQAQHVLKLLNNQVSLMTLFNFKKSSLTDSPLIRRKDFSSNAAPWMVTGSQIRCIWRGL